MRWLAIFTLASTALAADSDWDRTGGRLGLSRSPQERLSRVDLRSSWVTDSDMPFPARMPDLRRLDLTLTRIFDRGLRALKSAPAIEDRQFVLRGADYRRGRRGGQEAGAHLKRLDLRGTKITDSTLEFLSGVPSLEWLDIGWAQITDTGLDQPVATLTNLRWLAMGGNKLTDTALQFLRQLPQIQYLDLGGTQRTDSGLWSLAVTRVGLRAVASVTELRELSLAGTAVSSEGLQELKALAKLESLNLQGCQKVRDDAAVVIRGLTKLRTLDLKGSSMTPAAVSELRKAMPGCQIFY